MKRTTNCNADLDHPCDADDGEPCARCAEEHLSFAREWAVASPEERNTERYRSELIEAGRGHLLDGCYR
jgi:hypothetical protein